MRKLNINISIVMVVVITALLLIACKEDATEPQAASELEATAGLLNSTWGLGADNAVFLDDNTHDASWADFRLNINNATKDGGNYTVSGVPSGYTKVWPNSGNWSFKNPNDPSFILRSDGITVKILAINERSLSLEFEVDHQENAALRGVGGNWTFNLITN